MNVLMASTSFPRDDQDWRGRFIFDMATAIAESSADLSLWAPAADFLPEGTQSVLTSEDARWLDKLGAQGGMAHLLRNRPFWGLASAVTFLSRLNRACRRTPADVYQINWLQTALGLPFDGRPAVITVLGTDFGLLRIPGMVALLRHQLKRRKVILMPNASWMIAKLEKHFGDLADVRPNPFGVDKRWFDIERAPTKDGEDWVVVSRLTRAKLGYLLAWGEGLFGDERRLHLFGPMQESISLPDWVRYHGPTNPAELQQQWFPKATGLITLSQHDEGRPQIMLEAMAAALPIIASNLTAHADFIRDNETGWLVGSREELAALIDGLTRERADHVGHAAQQWIRNEIGTWSDYGTRCVVAYRQLLGIA